MLIERRLQPRIEVSGPVTLEVAGETVSAQLQNININGVQVELASSAIDLFARHRSPEGAWPVVLVKFGSSINGDRFLPGGIDCDLVTTRRLNQKQYVAGFRFVLPDLRTREQAIALVKDAAGA